MLFGIDLKAFIIEIVLTIIVLTISTILGIISDKLRKEKKTSNNLVNYLDIIANLMPELLVKYESIFRNGKGEDKKALVMNELTAYCIANKIDYTNEILSQAIDNYCKVSKQINRGK